MLEKNGYIIQKFEERKMGKIGELIQTRYSLRVGGKVTSVTLKGNVLALYLLMNGNPGNAHNFILDALKDFADEWKGDNGKGLSDFICQKMIESILGKKEVKKYQQILAHIGEE